MCFPILDRNLQYPLKLESSTLIAHLAFFPASTERLNISCITLQVYIKATGDKSAEMVTDEGAIYVTSNRGYNWKAAVQETVSATLNRSLSLSN